MGASRTARKPRDFRDEVDWGTSQEIRILKRWADLSPTADTARSFYKAGEYDDFDFIVTRDGDGLVLCYLEIKRRRSPLSKFNDAIFPKRKHTAALAMKQQQRIPMLAVTEYGCGSLVEVDLSRKPAREGDIQRRDRRDRPPVPHVFYEKKQLRVVAEGDE